MGDIKLNTKRKALGLSIAPGQELRQNQLVSPGQGQSKSNPEPDEFFGEETNDIQLNNLNDFDIISGTEKLKQDINKILLTELGRNQNFDLYGSGLQSLIGSKFNADFLRAKIENEIVSSLEILNFINRDNEDLDEVPKTLKTLEINEIQTGFEVILTVVTESDKLVTTSVVITS